MPLQTLTRHQTPVLTRREYVIESSVSHDDYYAQFATAQTLRFVGDAFGLDRLRKALDKDRQLNSIQLKHWDAATTYPVGDSGFGSRLPLNRELIAAAGETVTRSTLVCVAKRAARMLVEQQMSHPVAEAA